QHLAFPPPVHVAPERYRRCPGAIPALKYRAFTASASLHGLFLRWVCRASYTLHLSEQYTASERRPPRPVRNWLLQNLQVFAIDRRFSPRTKLYQIKAFSPVGQTWSAYSVCSSARPGRKSGRTLTLIAERRRCSTTCATNMRSRVRPSFFKFGLRLNEMS